MEYEYMIRLEKSEKMTCSLLDGFETLNFGDREFPVYRSVKKTGFPFWQVDIENLFAWLFN